MSTDIGNPTANHYHNRLTVKECQLNRLIDNGQGDTQAARELFTEVEALRQHIEDIDA